MKQSLIFTALTGLGLAFCSCSTITHTAEVASVNVEIYNLTVADLNVSEEKESVSTEWEWSPFSSKSLKEQKDQAAYELLDKTKSDVLVEPQYIVKRRGLFRGGTLTVTGYPAKYSNFRNMSKEDAEKIGIINGNVSTVLVDPTISTSAGFFSKKFSKGKNQPKVRKEDGQPSRRKFIDILYGPQFDVDGSLDNGYHLGLTYGNYGKSWGWYGKIAIASATGYAHHSYYWDEKERKTTMFVSGGAIKTLSRNWNFLFGIGVGGYTFERWQVYTQSPEVRFTMPVEIGFQWRASHINLMLGFNYAPPFAPVDDGSGTFTPSIGIGYSF